MVAVEGGAPVKAQEAADAKLNRTVVAQLSKTKMCAMFARGACYDNRCHFAHSAAELRSPPDLTKTAMCRAFAKGECSDPKCRFAHGEHELRVTPSVYKTQLCNFFERGYCKKGNRCRHAHGRAELRSSRAPAGPATPPAAEMPIPAATAGVLAARQCSSGLDTPEKTGVHPWGVPAPTDTHQWGLTMPEPMKVPLPTLDWQGAVERDWGLWDHGRDFGAIVDSIRTEGAGPGRLSEGTAFGGGRFVTPPRQRGLLRFLDSPSSPWHPASEARDNAVAA